MQSAAALLTSWAWTAPVRSSGTSWSTSAGCLRISWLGGKKQLRCQTTVWNTNTHKERNVHTWTRLHVHSCYIIWRSGEGNLAWLHNRAITSADRFARHCPFEVRLFNFGAWCDGVKHSDSVSMQHVNVFGMTCVALRQVTKTSKLNEWKRSLRF